MTLGEWRQLRPSRGPWRRRARAVIREVVDVITDHAPDVAAEELLARIDAAYPFGERQYAPYKAWLAERKLFRAALADTIAIPTEDEAAACEVARDMVLEGRIAEALAALKQAPNRLARTCPACDAMPGWDCVEVSPYDQGLPRLVPHHARLVGHRDAGPLFGGEP